MLVRAATQDDAPRVAAIHIASWRTAFHGVVPDAHLAAMDVRASERGWRHNVVVYPGNLQVLQDDDGALLGFACSGPSAPKPPVPAAFDGQVFGIHLDPARKGEGLGRLLMQSAFAWMLSQGCKGAHLWTFEANARARAFYLRCGGEVVAQSTIDFGGREIPELAYGWRNMTLVLPPRLEKEA